MSQTETILGIDLGTTNSVLSILENGQPKIIPVNGLDLLPSVVGVAPSGEILVGTPARNQWVVSPENTVRSIKRKMGSDEKVSMAGVEYTPQEISAFILREIKQAAKDALGKEVTGAVITVPAYFNEIQRQATLEAGQIAGLEVERIINEPTAAALAYGMGANEDEYLRVMVYDLGGGTFDVSVIEMNSGIVDVLATAGDNQLGGDDFDECLAEMIAGNFEDVHGIDLQENHQAWTRLLDAAEQAKIDLSFNPDTTVNLEFIAKDSSGNDLHIRQEVSRFDFIQGIKDLLDRTIKSIDQALDDAGLQAQDLDRVLLVGGSTRIPAIWDLVSRHLKMDPQVEIDPDAAVALGASVQGGIITGEEINAILVDITPLSLGIESITQSLTGHIRDDHFAVLIRRNSTIPVSKSEIFSTVHPGQDTIHVNVYQGENALASRNELLGDFYVENLKPNRPDGCTEVTVHFAIDVNGILDVTVTEEKNGLVVSQRLEAERRQLTPEQIAESQAKLNVSYEDSFSVDDLDIPAADTVIADPVANALIQRANQLLQNPDLNSDTASELRQAVENIITAYTQGDDEELEDLNDELSDLLMDLEDDE